MREQLIEIQTILLTIGEDQILGNHKPQRVLLFDAIQRIEKIIKPESPIIIADSWREKLRVFLEGLEVQHIEELMLRGKVGDYRRLAEKMTQEIKNLI